MVVLNFINMHNIDVHTFPFFHHCFCADVRSGIMQATVQLKFSKSDQRPSSERDASTATPGSLAPTPYWELFVTWRKRRPIASSLPATRLSPMYCMKRSLKTNRCPSCRQSPAFNGRPTVYGRSNGPTSLVIRSFIWRRSLFPKVRTRALSFVCVGGGVASLKILVQIWHFRVDKWHPTFRYDSFAILLYQVLVIYR